MNIKYNPNSTRKRYVPPRYKFCKSMKTVDKSSINDIKEITLICENFESFTIPSELIVDACFQIDYIDKKQFGTQSGYIKFANEAADILEKSFDDAEQCTLGERLLGYCDVCVMDVAFNDGTSCYTHIPYDPLVESMHGAEIELSNCPSIEFDENNDLVFLFGEKSKQFKRIDNNYPDLIIGWKNQFGDSCPLIIKGRLDGFSSFGNDFEQKYDLSFKSCNVLGKTLELRFINVTKSEINISFDQSYRDLCMSRTSTGKIYVDIEGTLTFFCSCVYLSGYDTVKLTNDKSYDDETFFKALYLTLPEDIMHDFAYAKSYPRGASIYVDHERIKRALESFLNGSLTREYLHSWIYFYKSMIDACDFHNELFNRIYAILDILYHSLNYPVNDSLAERFARKSYEQLKRIIG